MEFSSRGKDVVDAKVAILAPTFYSKKSLEFAEKTGRRTVSKVTRTERHVRLRSPIQLDCLIGCA